MNPNHINPDNNVTVAASVATGLEKVAANEIQEKFPYMDKSDVIVKQGRVYWKTNRSSLALAHKLRSIDRMFLIVKTCENYIYKETKEESYADLVQLAREINWSDIVKFWGYNKQYCKGKSRQENLYKKYPKSQAKGNSYCNGDKLDDSPREPAKDDILASSDTEPQEPKKPRTSQNGTPIVPNIAPDGTLVRYRVTTNRVGKKQPVTSPEASYRFGGEIQDITDWQVDLSNYNLEIMLCLGESSLEVAVALTLQSLHRRNITHFGATTLRATTAYCMLRMCNIQTGELVVDPMCGSGAIPVEGALEWPNSYHIGGDNTSSATERCSCNLQFINENPDFVDGHHEKDKRMNLRADTIQWDVTCLPLKTNSIDVVVSDLPFGKRVGSKVDNRKLYPALLKELARVTICDSGRACLLTQDKRTIKRSIDGLHFLWKLKKTQYINIGGLTAGVFLLQRTKNNFEDMPS
ncbi:tRNA (guanine(6)-N(2))-methyltransferase THUMP3-like [Styela clava]|uniref:THUMP domain-containing protein 3-like n=1 Tax=Styela clava TaxID=7725 RepID=UPI00193A4DD3|nr:THUMP domain-containing protein 3-like [Styela clava]XP_039267978.1 THUMP domain-containing protein 3-like [Styela clava]